MLYNIISPLFVYVNVRYFMIYAKIKKLAVFLLAIVFIFSMVGCSSAKNYDSLEISEKILDLAPFSNMEKLSGISLSDHFFFKDNDVKRFNVWVSANESIDTLACFEVKNDEQRSIVKKGIGKYLENLSISPKSPQESMKAENRLLVELDNIIILVICNDTTPVWDYLTELGAKESV